MNNSSAELVTVFNNLADLPSDVSTFLAEHTADELCLNGFWFALLLRHSPPPGQIPRIYVVRSKSDGKVDCVMFTMNASRRKFLRKLVSLTNVYTISYAPLLRRDLTDTTAPLNALVRYITREPDPSWDVIDLRGFIEENPVTGQLLRAFREEGMLANTYAQFENWFFQTNDLSADEYFKSRPSQVRYTIMRKLKKAQKEHRVAFHLYHSVQGLDCGLRDYEKIYGRSWKKPEASPDFVPQLLFQCAAHGHLRLGVLHIDDEPAAAQIWLVTGKRATIYKLAYDEKFSLLSVGSILTKMMFDRAIDIDKVIEVDYGVGSEPYKLDWMSDRRHIVGLICFNPYSVAGLLAACWHFAGRIKQWRYGRREAAWPDERLVPDNAIVKGTVS